MRVLGLKGRALLLDEYLFEYVLLRIDVLLQRHRCYTLSRFHTSNWGSSSIVERISSCLRSFTLRQSRTSLIRAMVGRFTLQDGVELLRRTLSMIDLVI